MKYLIFSLILFITTNIYSADISKEDKAKFFKRFPNDPGYVETKWEGNTFIWAVKSPPPKNSAKNYLSTLCNIANKELNVKGFNVKLVKLGNNNMVAYKTCN